MPRLWQDPRVMLSALVLFIKSVIVGFSMAAPVGPVGILCIRRSLRHGWKAGLATGLGVAVADSLYGIVAGFGLTRVTTALEWYELWVRLIGGLILLGVGLQIYFSSRPKVEAKSNGKGNRDGSTKRESLGLNFLSAFVLAVTNPLTILSFVAVYAALGFAHDTGGSMALVALFVLGIFVGSTAWWVLLAVGADRFRSVFSFERIGMINRACGAVIGVFGLYSLAQILVRL